MRAAKGPSSSRRSDLSLPRPLDGRPRVLPRQGRGRALAQARPDRPPSQKRSIAAAESTQAEIDAIAERRRREVERSRRSSPRRARIRRLDTLTRHVRLREEARAMPEITLSRRAAEALRDQLQQRRARLRHGRGHRRLRRLLRRDQGPPRRVRREARHRHADRESVFVGAGIGAAMAGLKPIVEIMTINFSLLAHRPDRQQRLEDPLHVRRPGQRADGHPHGQRRGQPARRPALAEPRELVRPRPGPQGRRARRRPTTRRAC